MCRADTQPDVCTTCTCIWERVVELLVLDLLHSFTLQYTAARKNMKA